MMSKLSDVEIILACARAMGYTASQRANGVVWSAQDIGIEMPYRPLSIKEQAMDLVIKLRLDILNYEIGGEPAFDVSGPNEKGIAVKGDLLVAICLCVAQMQLAKEKSTHPPSLRH
jgi:hypothetical protein